ncbi:RelA/SpoT domain-containing protein [Rhizobium mesosinicum]|uniref:RelA/SpoT domain-containing protein n=1 Tax=Rhizobium mesosinicum TaxID=335017 RepID=A0ABS7GMB6_9HYPH|nr:RelA/SpoT domain-containing protein [Rhizobium mesosinicum]MBW9051120.1 RelA/SpoT domain-containing protein [Rhizobium mesosinicum]
MPIYPELQFSMHEVRAAGKRLKDDLRLTPDVDWRDAHHVFAVANSWRDSHFFPMRSVYLSVAYRMRKIGIKGDMAARPKRMASIRRKLRDSDIHLDRMQDIGGCRAILDDIAGVRSMLAEINEDFPHHDRRQWPYIDEPKEDGYRSHHVSFEFRPRTKEQSVFAGRRVEFQIRTRLQHSWATAVEAVSLFNGEDLKHHRGSAEWLRLFKLMSGEFAYVEGCPVGPGVPDRPFRISEIKALEAKLDAISTLENIRTATTYAETHLYGDGKFFLIVYNNEDHTVAVERFSEILALQARLAIIERQIEDGLTRSKVVTVEVSRVENLVRTYPNYFGDVGVFLGNLRRIVQGKDALEFTLIQQARVIVPKPQPGDVRNLTRRYTRWYPS